MDHLYRSLAGVEWSLTYDENASAEKQREFYDKLLGILLRLNDRAAFIERGGLAAKAMLEYGVSLFCGWANYPGYEAESLLEALKRTLDLLDAHPEASKNYGEYAKHCAAGLIERFYRLQKLAPGRADALCSKLSEQLTRLSALD